MKAFLFIIFPLLSLTGKTDFTSVVLKNSTIILVIGNHVGLRKGLLEAYLSLRERAFLIPSFKTEANTLKLNYAATKLLHTEL